MNESLFRLPFGLKDGELVEISAVERGLACGCVCPACGEQLVARKGITRQHHFAHANGAECATAVETALHLAAKAILERRREIVLPEVSVCLDYRFPGSTHGSIYTAVKRFAPERRYKLDSVRLERHIGNVIPDVVAVIGGRQLIIEMRVTHKVDTEKISRIRRLGMSAIEIDLSGVMRSIALSELESLVIEAGKRKVWLVNILTEQIKKRCQGNGYLKSPIPGGVTEVWTD